MKPICQIVSAITSFVRAFGAMSFGVVSLAVAPSRSNHWRSLATTALLTAAFLLPAFAAQAQIATTTTLTSSENPSHVSDSVTFTATVSSNGNGAPTGSVLFIDFKTTFNEVTVPLTPGTGDTSTATVTFATIDPGTLQTGIHGMQASYQPSGNFGSSSGGVVQQVIADGTTGTTTSLISSQNPSETGQSVTFTATVTAVSGSTVPTGTVSFFVDGTSASTTTLNNNGVATFTTSALTGSATGTQHNVAAVYNPTGSFATSTSANLVQTVSNGIPTTVTVSGSPNPSAVNQAVTMTATVAVAAGFTGPPTGTVDLSVIFNGTNHIVASGVTLSNGTASATAPGTLFTGAQSVVTLQALYHATGNFQDQTVGQSSQFVTSGTATTATLTSSPNPSFVGGAVSFTATIKTASGTPTGNLNFVDNSNGGNSIGTVTLAPATGGAAATLSNVTSLTAGTHNIEAVYAGDGTFAASTATVTQTVNTPVATTTTVASSANPSLVGQSVTFTATVSPQSGTATPTGSVIFTIDGTASAPIKLSGGVATTSTSALTVAGSPA